VVKDWQTLKRAARPFDVVLLSCERDEHAFQAQIKTYPFLAVPFSSSKREAALAKFKVSAIPRLIILDPNGNVIVDNATGIPGGLSIESFDKWAAMTKTKATS